MSDDDTESSGGAQIAIVGLAGRFPGARNLDEFWENLQRGRESVKFFSDEELLARGEPAELLQDPSYVKAWPVLDDIEQFDAAFFGMSPRDAAVMDPQHRIFFEVAWHALEHAGYSPETSPSSTGVFAACGMNSYMMHHLVQNQEIMDSVGEWLIRHTGNDMNFLATRASYQMNLKGPSLNVQTACSSALTAVHLACQSLLNGECDMALAGASTLSLPQDRGYLAREGEILAPDGHCRPFDAAASGTLFGSGAGCFVLKRLDDALRDGDEVHCVILGSAVNNDGSNKVGYLAPSVEGQARAVAEALAISGVDPESISYVEAHGTGTKVGDPIEVTALTQAYRAHTDKRHFCAIGSVKGNIGHLGEAAGMAGLAKLVLSMRHGKLPPSINFEKPNPEIDFENSPFYVNTQLRDWQRGSQPRRAAITALGAGGTNVHLVLEEPRARPPTTASERPQLITLSARSAAALDQATAQLAEHLSARPQQSLADVAFTLQLGRRHFSHRRVLVARDSAGTAAALRALDPKSSPTQAAGRSEPPLVFMFPGGGAQYARMGVGLYSSEPTYRAALDECLNSLPQELATELRRLLFADAATEAAASLALERPSLALPVLFATEYATAKLLISWGVTPVACIGHSMGEYVAACLAGVFSSQDGMALVAARGRLFETLPEGGMLSVALPEAELAALLPPELSIAAVNAASLCVASGPRAAIDALEAELTRRDVDCTPIHISVAAHSAMLTPILAEFERICRGIRLAPPTLPFVSNLTGTWITSAEATDPSYWVRHLRSTVKFAQGVAELLREGPRLLLEVGPGRTLSSLARQHASAPSAHPSLRHPKEAVPDLDFLLLALGKLWLAGAKLDFAALHGEGTRRRLPLPGYPFEGQRFWIEPSEKRSQRRKSLEKTADVSDWFRAPSWRRAGVPPTMPVAGPWIVFCDTEGVCEDLLPLLADRQVIKVVRGESFLKVADDQYYLRVDAPVDYDSLFTDLALRQLAPQQIVYAWPISKPHASWPGSLLEDRSPLAELDRAQRACFFGLLFLAQALGAQELPATLSVVSNGLHAFEATGRAAPEKALLLGPTRVIPREFQQLRTRSIDLDLPAKRAERGRTLQALATELVSEPRDQVLAVRSSGRWVQHYERLPLAKSSSTPTLRPGGTYLLTGGLGGIGLVLAKHLAVAAQAKLVLIGRTGLPERSTWPALVAAGDPVARRIEKVLEIEASGAQVLVVGADVTSLDEMTQVVELARRRFGAIHGVVHSAGLIDDGLISLKTQESAERVLSVKTRGALVLEAALGAAALDFFVVFSSISSVLGLEGQVDYTAANAFLDAFAERKTAQGKTLALSIGWNAWREIGMAVALAEQPLGVELASAGTHPCLERVAVDNAEQTLFVTSFSRTKHWLVSEHVVRGSTALIPGTGYLELARAGLEHRRVAGVVELCDVTFLSPFAVGVAESRELRLKLGRAGSGDGEFVFYSDAEAEPHVTGRIGYVDRPRPAALDLAALRQQCNLRERRFGGFIEQAFMDFGQRWANVESVAYGQTEALISLRLAAAFRSDLSSYRLHPALLDMATGGAQALLEGFAADRDFYVPFAYGRVTVHASLTPECYSYVRLKPSPADIALFDATICDAKGNVLVEVVNFTMRRVSAAALFGTPARKPRKPAGDEPSSVETRIGSAVRLGITNQEGMDAFERLLAAGVGGQVIASSVDLEAWLGSLEAQPSQAAASSTRSDLAGDASGFARPALSREFVAPRNDIERGLAAIWRELLGIAEVGVHDDFFDLGGTSLVAVRLFNKIRKQWGVSLPLSTLFEAPNIEGCARIIAEELGVSLESSAELTSAEPSHVQEGPVSVAAPKSSNGAPSRDLARERVASPSKKTRWPTLVAMQPKGAPPAFFCIAGLGGNLNNLRKLAILAGDERPVYGLQPPGADDPSKLIYSVPELAEHYLKEVRAIQPHGPYFLGGYSGGGITAFEMCQRLTAEGEEIAFLGLIDSYSPELPQRTTLERAQIHLQRMSADGPRYLLKTLERRVNYERYELQRRVSRTLRSAFPDRFRYEQIEDSWLVAQAAYRPPAWQGSATLFRARELGSMSLWTAVKDDEQHGWGRYLLGGVDVQLCPGNHNTMCEEPNVRVLAAHLREALRRSAEAVKSPASSQKDGAASVSAD